MTDRIVLFAENGRTSTRGIKQTGEGEFLTYQRDAETYPYTFDYEAWLSGDTISAVARTASGTTVSATSNTTLQAIQSLHGQGYVDIQITTTAGRIKQDRICVQPRSADQLLSDPYR